MTTQYTAVNNIIRVSFTAKHNQPCGEVKQAETLAEMFKRHKVVVPSELIFKYK